MISPYKHKRFWQSLLLYPLSLLYGMVIRIRHFLFDCRLIARTRFNFPVVVVGNLTLGGTGKTPFTAYLCQLLSREYRVAMVSRGYKRKTLGFLEVTRESSYSEVGDEPYWFKQNFPETQVFVGEDRVLSIANVLYQYPFTDVVLLDDAFQHRKLDAGLNIVLTDYSNLYVEDKLVPLGTLRDSSHAICRAQVVIVTKCPPSFSVNDTLRQTLKTQLKLKEHQSLFFSSIQYGVPYPIIQSHFQFHTFAHHHVLLITGIANPVHLVNYLASKRAKVTHKAFSDHFDFSYEDIIDLMVTFDKMPAPKMLVCTEKDAVKLQRFQKYWEHIPVFVLPITFQLLHDEKQLSTLLHRYIHTF